MTDRHTESRSEPASEETLVAVNGVELCAQTFGAPADRAILLVMGAGAAS